MDFVIARNIVEHIADIEMFLRELVRVARRGYITAPSTIAEKLFSWDKHVWFTAVRDQELRLVAKEKPIYDSDLSALFHSLHASDRQFQQFYRNHQELFVTEYHWEDSIHYSIEGEVVEGLKQTQAMFDYSDTYTALTSAALSRGIRASLQRILRVLFSSHRANQALAYIDKLACPVCHNILKCDDLRLLCEVCEIHYPVINHVPVLVQEAAF